MKNKMILYNESKTARTLKFEDSSLGFTVITYKQYRLTALTVYPRISYVVEYYGVVNRKGT